MLASSFEAISTLIQSNLKHTIFNSNSLLSLFLTLHYCCPTGPSGLGQSWKICWIGSWTVSTNKQLLVFLAGLFNISYSGLSELKLRNKIKERRDEIHIVVSELPEKPATDPVPDEQTDRSPGWAGRSNATQNDQEQLRDQYDQSHQSEGCSQGDPPAENRSINDGGDDPQDQGNQRGGSFREPIGARGNQETPGGGHVTLFQLPLTLVLTFGPTWKLQA
jgi:hypothetical protein